MVSFEEVVVDCLVVKLLFVMKCVGVLILCVGGGVVVNCCLCEWFEVVCEGEWLCFVIVLLEFCMDNVVMGVIVFEYFKCGSIDMFEFDVMLGLICLWDWIGFMMILFSVV